MTAEGTIYVLIFGALLLVIARLDRLGRQFEAVSALIRSELVTDEHRKDEIISEWKNAQKETAKEARRFWIFWSIVGAVVLGWIIMQSRW